jgi:hypothetical protein
MPEALPPKDDRPQRSSRTLFFVMLGVILLFIVAFLILKPDPTGAGHSSTPATTDH